MALKDNDFYATEYPGTDAGLVAALAYITSGGKVWVGPGDLSLSSVITVPEQATLILGAGTYTMSGSASFVLSNKSTLRGQGMYSTTLAASATTSVTGMIRNANTDGTQQACYIEHLGISGNKSAGATITAGISLAALYVGTTIRSVLIIQCSGNGIKLDGSTYGLGQMLLDDIIVTTSNDHNILITGACDSVYGVQITSESAAAGKAQIKITRSNPDNASFGHTLMGVHFEGTAACDGLLLDSCASTCVIGIVNDGTNANNVIKITGSVTGSDGAFGSAGHTFRNVFGNYTTIIDDQVSGVTVGNSQGRFVQEYICPKQVQSGGNDLYTGQIIGLQYQRQGIDVASAAALTLGNGNFFTVTGTADITSITTAARDAGRIVTLLFSGTAGTTGLTDGSNLKIAGNLAYTPDDTITLISNGTNWYEICRSVN